MSNRQSTGAMLIAFALALCMILSGCEVNAYTPTTNSNLTQPSNTNSPLEIESIYENDEDYTLTVHYPTTNNTEIDDTLSNFIVSRIISFKDGLLEAFPGSTSQGSNQEIDGLYRLDFDVIFDSHDCLSLTFYETARINGKEICNEVYTFNFNRHTGDGITIENLFSRSPQYLEILSKLCIQEIMETSPEDFEHLKDATLPYALNFSRYNVMPNGIKIMLPYEKGVKSVSISEVELKGLLAIDSTAFSKEYLPIYPFIPEVADTQQPLASEAAYFSTPKVITKVPAKKQIALTFDDGPHKQYTGEILDILKANQAKATFFMLGNRVNFYPAIAKRIVDEGHGIGNHSFNHPQLTKLDETNVKNQILATQNALLKHTQKQPLYVRVPFGRFNEQIQGWIQMPLIQWSIDPEDWRQQDPSKIAQHVLDHAKDGAIVVLHDIHGNTAKALPTILKGLNQMGYECVTVDVLLGITPESTEVKGRVYYKK